nr:site-specific DNA-methyltransferase [uncultured Flavobacterium sp.]
MSTQVDLFTTVEPTSVSPAIAKPFVSRSTFYQGDCLVEMDKIADKSVDMILCDLPYGTTACKWDSVIPFEPLWKQYERVIKDNGAIVLFASQPFTSLLVASNIKLFKYEWVWDKVQPTGALTVKKMPMKQHENILVFYKQQPTYNRQMTDRKKEDLRVNAVRNKNNQKTNFGYEHTGGMTMKYAADYDPAKVNPKSILTYSKQPTRTKNLHPTQKPVELLKYLCKTYTNEFETVLDNTMGSGSTGVACKELNRHFIGIEKDEKYFEIAKNRINEYK